MVDDKIKASTKGFKLTGVLTALSRAGGSWVNKGHTKRVLNLIIERGLKNELIGSCPYGTKS